MVDGNGETVMVDNEDDWQILQDLGATTVIDP